MLKSAYECVHERAYVKTFTCLPAHFTPSLAGSSSGFFSGLLKDISWKVGENRNVECSQLGTST